MRAPAVEVIFASPLSLGCRVFSYNIHAKSISQQNGFLRAQHIFEQGNFINICNDSVSLERMLFAPCNTVHRASKIIEARASERVRGRQAEFMCLHCARSNFHNGKKGRQPAEHLGARSLYLLYIYTFLKETAFAVVLLFPCNNIASLLRAGTLTLLCIFRNSEAAAAAISFFLTIVTPPKTTTPACVRMLRVHCHNTHAAAKVSEMQF